jgi:hypothetical protein
MVVIFSDIVWISGIAIHENGIFSSSKEREFPRETERLKDAKGGRTEHRDDR